MTLDTHLNDALAQLLAQQPEHSITKNQLIHCIDLTLLDDTASQATLTGLVEQANSHQVAALCFFMQHFHEFNSVNVNKACVINFPGGNEPIAISLSGINDAVAMGVNEIDYVLPYQEYLLGNKAQALQSCQDVAELCQNLGLTLKIILETGAFPDTHSIYIASQELLKTGCHFLKTSTGKIANGASYSAAFAMLGAIKEASAPCGLKVSGGIKTPAQAFKYAYLAELMLGKRISKDWFRIGASSLLAELAV